MSTQKEVLAIDFGTANTYVSRCGLDNTKASGIDLDGGRDGMSTALLYRKGKSTLIGEKALEEFGEATPEERQDYTLFIQFKPDIAHSPKARQAAQDFLTQIIATAEKANVFLDPTQKQVLFGIPSESSEDFIHTLKSVAKQAGFGDVETRDEPEGALFFHISHGEIPAQKALSGGLVVDFGGGTCDFAFMHRGKVQHSWGDFELGGRLFDDLFFQWFLEQCPHAAKQMEEKGDAFFVHAYRCREVKEYFSRSIEQDRKNILRKKIGEHGQMQEVTWEAFLRRARSFRLSDMLREHWTSLQIPLGRLGQKQPIDLLAWFRESLTQGWKEKHFDVKDIQYVILTGGSSQWPFVKDIVQEELQLPNESLIRSSKPYAAISEGLAALPALKIKFDKLQRDLTNEFPLFFNQEIKSIFSEKTPKIVQEIAEQIIAQLYDRELKSLLEDFRQKGGAIATLKKSMADCTQRTMPALETIVQEKITSFFQALAVDVLQKTNRWLKDKGLSLEERKLHLSENPVQHMDSWELPDLYEEIASTITAISVVIVGSLTAMISGGAGTALIATGPLGLVIGLILGAIVSYLALRYGTSKAKEMAETWEVSPWMIGFALSDSKLATIRSDLYKQIADKLTQTLLEAEQKLLQQLEELARNELSALSEINQI